VVIASHESNLVEPLANRAVTITGGRVTGERTIERLTGATDPAAGTLPAGATLPGPVPAAVPPPDVEHAVHVA
jgi:hypothetical protein